MQAQFMGRTIISTTRGFKLLGKANSQKYPKTVAGLDQLTTAILIGSERQ